MKNLSISLKSISHSGSHIGRNITIRIQCDVLGLDFEIKKNVLPDKTTQINKIILNTELEKLPHDIILGVTVTERDAGLDDVGIVAERVYIAYNEEVSEKDILVEVTERRVFFWKKTARFVLRFEITVPYKDKERFPEIRQYTNTGLLGTEDYNRYDTEIIEAVSYWNDKFGGSTNPPSELLDPSLVKAILYHETLVGYAPNIRDKNPSIDVMQVAYYDDFGLSVLQGKGLSDEYWFPEGNGIPVKLEYPEAKVETPRDSIFWGVRWLYHKAKENKQDKNGKWYTSWLSWKDGVQNYGPGGKDYVENIWSIYTNGVNKRDGKIKLWSFSLLFLGLLTTPFLGVSDDKIRQEAENFIEYDYSFRTSIDVVHDTVDQSLFAVINQDSEDWWEWVKVGKVDMGKIIWLPDFEYETGPASGILSVKFLHLNGINVPILEVFSQNHKHSGFIDLYQITDNDMRLLFRADAVDNYRENRWDPEGYPELGGEWKGGCSSVFSDRMLHIEYKDVNSDGIDDVILSGTKEIYCRRTYDDKEDLVMSIPIHREYIIDPKAERIAHVNID